MGKFKPGGVFPHLNRAFWADIHARATPTARIRVFYEIYHFTISNAFLRNDFDFSICGTRLLSTFLKSILS